MKPIHIAILNPELHEPFPAINAALDEPNGLLAAGGDLSPARLLEAYRHGIFPWFSHGDPILWWSPDPRMVFATDRVHISTKLQRWLRRCDLTVRADTAFIEVMHACAKPRPTQPTTWISREMIGAYATLHDLGHAHSVEVFDGDALVGGIYGVAVGRMFYGESMFSARSNGSKVALIALCRQLHEWDFPLLDAQVTSDHLITLGAFEMPRARFATVIEKQTARSGIVGNWQEKLTHTLAREFA
jgi:leucyl/phenylalanyl-tRNA---protein transferase